jgi:hypothetical protein
MEKTKRATIYFDVHVHQALRLRAAASNRSISEMVNEAVRISLAEDADDPPLPGKMSPLLFANPGA